MRRTFRDEYEQLLPSVEKPGRYLGNERGAIRKDLDTRPDPRRSVLPGGLRDRPVAPRAADPLRHPEPPPRRRRRARATPRGSTSKRCCAAQGLPLVSLESHLPLSDFHVVGFSLQYELTYTNLLTMLELGGIPLRGARRTGAASARDRRRTVRLQSRAAGALSRRRRARRRRGGRRPDRRRRRSAGTDATAPRCSRAVAAVPGVYVPAFFSPRYAGRWHASPRSCRATRAPDGARSACCPTSTPSRRPATRSCRTSTSSTTAPASR